MTDNKFYSFTVRLNEKNNTVTLTVGGFVTKEEQEKFADLLNETIKYDKLYLLQAMSKFEELLELDEWDEIEKKHTIH
tara:strand:- start:560 stop:793 length:234 start_codon:yes stop_codon:yes gene_type:complete